MAYMGIDIGTSGVKVVICDEQGAVIGSHSEPLSVQNPRPMWSEQQPLDWWLAVSECLDKLAHKGMTRRVTAIGLTGQMHGAVLLNENNEVLRPAIMWNDGRSAAECDLLTNRVKDVHGITGNLVMPGFTAPKLLWVANNEPDLFSRVAKVLLPKDYIRFLLCGTFYSDMSDAAGTSWLDVAKRDWSAPMLAACGLTAAQMPELCEGNQITGRLHMSLANRWGMSAVPIAGGGGDNAAGAVGSGVVFDGQTILSLGTSGVLFSASERYLSNPKRALHSFCHAIPGKWHVMSVHLSAASCLQWFADIAAQGSVDTLLDELENSDVTPDSNGFFLPYLSGERTPYNNPSMGGEFVGISASTTRANMTYAILEGIAFAFKNGLEVMHEAGVFPSEISIIGGGARSKFWRQLIADVLEVAIVYREGGDVGPALGAARLAQLALHPERDIEAICPAPAAIASHLPRPEMTEVHNHRYSYFKQFSEQASQRRIWEQLT